MSEIDERLATIRARVEGATPDDLGFFDGMAQASMLSNARSDLGYLLDMVERLHTRAEAAEAEVAALREWLAQVEALVPEAEWLEMIAVVLAYDVPYCGKCPFGGDPRECGNQCGDVWDWARDLAADIRAWREGQEAADG